MTSRYLIYHCVIGSIVYYIGGCVSDHTGSGEEERVFQEASEALRSVSGTRVETSITFILCNL